MMQIPRNFQMHEYAFLDNWAYCTFGQFNWIRKRSQSIRRLNHSFSTLTTYVRSWMKLNGLSARFLVRSTCWAYLVLVGYGSRIPCWSRRFVRLRRSKADSKTGGLSLKENSSGKHKGQTTLSKRGRPKLRSLLFRGVMPLLAKNAEFQELHRYYTKRTQNPLKEMQSAVALSYRLIRVLFALGRKQVPYDPMKVLGPVHVARLQDVAWDLLTQNM